MWHLLDTRRGYCYSSYKNGECGNPSSMVVTKSACCCANRGGAMSPAWGSPCAPCPTMGSKEFLELCPRGPGSGQEDGNFRI